AGRSNRIDVGIEPAFALRRRDAHGPMTGTAHVGGAAALERLHGADLVALVVMRAVRRLDQFLEDVIKALSLEVTLLLRHPFLQPEVRLDDEFVLCHVVLLCPLVGPNRCGFGQQQSRIGLRFSRCSAMRRAPIILTWSSISRRAAAPSRISINEANSLWAS